ncbi:ribonuclease H-like domain-containing protein [Tanacetum coccineum]|uniref:Ribonuclease H-like domain-containing protein n=1 Tax=Tanacetum coccineum TaxID=301880 RepID=A0ABQ5JAB6_9ASTR
MDLENTQNNSLAKLPLLKQGEYDTWRLRIESYIQLQDYTLWEIIEEGNSFKPVARTTTDEDGTSTTTIPGAVTAEQKILKKNDLKARSILMMTLPSEHLLTFNKHKDVKSLFEAIEVRFCGNEATKKTQKTLLKKMLQKIVSQLTILGEIITPEEFNLKFLRSLPTEWSHSSTNDVNTANVHVSTGSTHVSTASTNNSTACLSDATQESFIRELVKRLSSMEVYDKKKVECFNCHKLRHFARECRNPRSQDSSRRIVNVEESSSKAMLAIDGSGFDWSYMADDEASTNFALMAFSDSEVQNNKTCSKTCLKIFEDLKSKYDKLRIELNNDASVNESDINALKKHVERLKKEKEDNQFKIDNFENASKSLDQLIGNQISDNNKKGLGYNVVPPPLTGLFAPPSIDLSNSGLEKFKQPEFEGYGVKVNKGASENVSKEVKKTSDAPIIEDWVSDCDEDETVVLESLNVQKPKQADQPRKVSQNPRNNSTSWNTPMPKKLGVGFQFTPKACFVCGSFNHLIKDCDFHDKRMVQKPVLNNVKKGTGQREVRPVWTNAMRVNHQKFSNSRRNFAPTAVLTKSGLVPLSTARQSFSRTTIPISAARSFNTDIPSVNVAKPRTNAFQKSHSSLRRPFYQQTTLKNRNLNNKVNTAKVISVNTVKGKRMTSVVGEQGINVVKPITYWAWRPKIKMINHVYKNTGSCISNSWLVQDQTVLALAIPGQTATGKESSNPFMSKESHAETLTMLMKKVKRLEDKLKSIFDEEYRKLCLVLILLEKKYPLKKEILEKMINLKIEAEEERKEAKVFERILSKSKSSEVNDLSKHIYKYGDLSSSFNMNYITLRGMAVFPNINTVCVINGCGKQSLGTWYDSCEKLAAEHMYFLRGHVDAERKTCGWNNCVGWMENAELIMNIYGEAACDGSYIEKKESVMVWHYKNAGEFEQEHSKDILEHLEKCLQIQIYKKSIMMAVHLNLKNDEIVIIMGVGRGTIATGCAEQGTGPKKTTVTGVEMSKKSLDNVEAGDNVDLPLRGISRTGIQIGQVHSRQTQWQMIWEINLGWTFPLTRLKQARNGWIPSRISSSVKVFPRHIFNNLNQTSTAKEIWDNVEMLMQGSGRTIQQRKEDLFDEYERFRAIGNESIHDYFVRFHKLVNDMKITQLNIPTHQMNTKFVNNLPAYWGKYVTNVKQNMDISTTPYVQIYTHLKAYEPHAKKTLKKQEQSTSIVDPLAYVAHTTSAPALSSPSTPSPQPTAQSPNDALMATMTQIANLLSGFQKQFPPTNNQLRTSSNSKTHATVYDGQIVTEPIQRKAPGNVGNTGLTTTNVLKQSEDAYDQYCGGRPHNAAVASWPTCHPLVQPIIQSMRSILILRNKVRQEQALVIQRNKRNAELVQENDLLKSTLSGKEKSIAFLQSEKEKILSEKKDLADSYLDEIVCLKTANKVARDMLQRFNMPTQTIPMLSKKPKKATNDLHKDILGTRNPGLGYMAKRAQPVLYDADTLLHPNHHPVSIWDSDDVLVHQVVSMKKMNEKPGHVRPANDFYTKLNALMFVPQKELSGDQAYWLSANEIASQASKPATPGTPFVHKSRPPSQVLASLQKVNAVFPQFEGIIKERTTQKPDYVSEWCYDYAKQFVEQQLVPFYDHFKKHIQAANDTFFKEIREFEQIFDELEAEYEQCVLDNKNLTIEKKNLLIKNDCLIAECLEKDICSIVLTSDIVVPPSSNCLCEAFAKNLDVHAIGNTLSSLNLKRDFKIENCYY